jgi:hypothetical protein
VDKRFLYDILQRVEASMKDVYIQNNSPHKIMKNMTPEEAFTGVKPEVGHFRIFGCPIYIHVPKEKRTKLDPSGRKGTFVGYNESSKEYQIYIPGQRQIEVSRDVTFEEDIAFQRSRESHMEIDNEKKEETIPSPPSSIQRETFIDPIDRVDPIYPFYVPRDIAVGQKRPAWARQNLQEAEGHATPRGTFQESKRPHRFSSYVSAMSHIIDTEPSFHGEVAGQQVWNHAMTKEYQSIMKNVVWDIVLRPKGKSVVTSKWIYKIKHATDGSVEKYKVIFVDIGFSQVEGIDYE